MSEGAWGVNINAGIGPSQEMMSVIGTCLLLSAAGEG